MAENTKPTGKNTADQLTEQQRAQVRQILDQLHAVTTKEAASLLSRIPIAETREAMQELLATMRGVQRILDEIRELEPYINEELDKPEYAGITIIDLLDKYEPRDLQDGPPQGSTLAKILDAARLAAGDNLPKVTYNKALDLELNLDKLNTTLYDFRTPKRKQEIEGQLSLALTESKQKPFMPVKYERANAPEVTLFFNYSFDHELMQRLHLPENIDDEDYFYLSLIADNYIKGNDLISATKLYRDLNGVDPNATQLSKLVDRLYKLISTTIYINDKEVLSAWNKPVKETYNEIVGPLAPMIMHATRYTVNGRAVDGNIKITGFPIVFQTGREIGQITTVPKALLAVKREDGRNIRHTQRYYRALHYLIHEIARIKNGTRKNKLLYDTFIDEMGEKTTRGKQLATEMLFMILDHFKREGWIKGYKEETTKSTGKVGVKILFADADKNKLPAPKKRKNKEK